jgi:Fic family protein
MRKPPFSVNPRVLSLVSEISLLLGRYEGIHAPVPQPKLRKQNRIRTIQGSLAIEGNTLDLDQVTAIFSNQRVQGPRKDILEVQNTIRVYESLHELKLTRRAEFLKAHRMLMDGLSNEAGRFRKGAVGILKGSKVAHVAPSAKLVPELMDELLEYWKSEQELSPLILACVVHYETEFIHPFSDGNGRMGRFAQSWILAKFHRCFEYLPVESLIKERQTQYYDALGLSDRQGDSTPFVEFSLETVRDALKGFLEELKPAVETAETRLGLARSEFGDHPFTRKDFMRLFKTISSATASRDLARGVLEGVLSRRGTKNTASYRFKK